MAKIKLSGDFTIVSEGIHTFTVKSVEYKDGFAKCILRLETEKGELHSERFMLDNSKALYAFTMTVKALMNNNDISEIDPTQLVGKSMIATVKHDIVEDKTYARLVDKMPANTSTDTTDDSSDDDVDLNDLFGED